MSKDQSQPSWGVVMPFYHNKATIDACLGSFLAQTRPPNEIIVMDDGSLSPDELRALRARWPAPVVIETRPHAGQSACTNAAILRATSDYLLLTCADMVAPRCLMQWHQAAHAQRADEVAVVGPLPYARTVPMNPLMCYLSLPGVQFCFNEMTDPEHVNPMHCYAPNVSVLRDALLRVNLFDESFIYGLQDTDLGRRLGDAGIRFVLEPRAYAFHARGATLRGYLWRQRMVGRGLVRWMEKYPEDPPMAAQLLGVLRHTAMHTLPFDRMVEQAVRAYAEVENATRLAKETYHELFDAFGRLFAVAAGKGARDDRGRLQAVVHRLALQGTDITGCMPTLAGDDAQAVIYTEGPDAFDAPEDGAATMTRL